MMTDVILFCGQSNMQGQAEVLLERDVNENAFEYKLLCDSIVPLVDPVGENIRTDYTEGQTFYEGMVLRDWLDSHIAGSAVYGNTTLVPHFCDTYTSLTGRRAVAVHVAKGSTEISYWVPGTPAYELLVKKAKAAIARTREQFGECRVFLAWLQGESDAVFKRSRAYYTEQITKLAHSLKEDVGLEKFGIIRVGKFTMDERDDEIIGAQDDVCEKDDSFIMLTRISEKLISDPTVMHPTVRAHYGSRGLKILGDEAGKTLAKYVLEN